MEENGSDRQPSPPPAKDLTKSNNAVLHKSLPCRNESVSDITAKRFRSFEGVEGMGLASQLRKLSPVKTAEAVMRHWPNLSAAARELGVSPVTLHMHRKRSPWFQRLCEEADARGCDALEKVLYERGVSGDEYTFNDRIAYLRAHRPELYNPTKVIRLEDGRVPIKEASARAKLTADVMDAEIVEDYKSRKALKQARQRRGGGGM